MEGSDSEHAWIPASAGLCIMYYVLGPTSRNSLLNNFQFKYTITSLDAGSKKKKEANCHIPYIYLPGMCSCLYFHFYTDIILEHYMNTIVTVLDHY